VNEEWLRALVESEPRSFQVLEELTGQLNADVEGTERFGVSRFDLPGALDSASITFDPFRGPGRDPEIELYRLCVRLPLERALAVLAASKGPPTPDEIEGEPAHRFGHFTIRPLDNEVLLDWTRQGPTTYAPFNAGVRTEFLARLPAALAEATTAQALRRTTDPPPGAGITRRAQAQGTQAAPYVTLTLDPPADAPELCESWGIEPVAFSPDVHQHSWQLPALDAGRWTLRARLEERPPGPLPERTIGPSPAYDVVEGAVTTLDISA
jgi:hypothetical protein